MILGALIALEIVCLVLSVLVSRRERAHRAIALLAAAALVDELAVELLHRAVLESAPHPFAGWARLAYHLETGIVLGWPALLAAAAWRVFAWPAAARSAAAVLGGFWGATLAGMILRFPLAKGTTAPLLHAFAAGAALGALAGIPGAWGRPWKTAHACALLLVANELAIALIGPFAHNPFRDWQNARIAYIQGFAALAFVQARALRRAAAA